MAAQPNMTGMARLLYFTVGVAATSWGLWGAAAGWKQWTWLTLGGLAMLLGIIGYSPLHALFGTKDPKAN
jgi:uncharacterized membrane protein YuzA (DUF378 family)